MAEFIDTLSNWIWDDKFWLPENVTWKDMERDETTFTAYPRDLWILLPMSFIMFAVRLLWERFVALPLGRRYKLRETPPSPPISNDVLEKAFRQHRKILPHHDVVTGLAKQCDLSTRQIERWWRRRRVLNKPSEMQRFKETSWRFLFYFSAFWYGIIILWNKDFFWETAKCWIDYPRQHITDFMYWYYIVELSFYGSLVISLYMDNKRKDFWEMLVHHFATISLMVFSYVANFVRIGCLVLVCHDTVDWIMEGAKMAKYLRYHKLCDAMFVVFTIMWYITRLHILPWRIIWHWLFEAHYIIGTMPSYQVFSVLMCTLQVLHCFWFYLICRMVVLYIISGKVEKDERSETDETTGSDEADIVAKTQGRSKKNGATSTAMNGNNNVAQAKIMK